MIGDDSIHRVRQIASEAPGSRVDSRPDLIDPVHRKLRSLDAHAPKDIAQHPAASGGGGVQWEPRTSPRREM